MAEDADDPNHLADFVHTVRDVARVTDELLAAGNLDDCTKSEDNTRSYA